MLQIKLKTWFCISACVFFLPSTDTQGSLIHPLSNGCSSPVDQQQRSPSREQRSSSPLSSEILQELSRYTSSTGDAAAGMGNELPSSPDMSAVPSGDGGTPQNSHTGQLTESLLGTALEMRGTKRKSTEGQSNTQIGGKRTSTAATFPGLSMSSSGLSFPPVGLNSSSLLGNLGHMSHPILMSSSGGSSFLQTSGQSLADLQTLFPPPGSDLLRPSPTGNGHLSTSSSSSSLLPVFSSASTTIPMSSTPSAATSSLAQGSLPQYLINPNMAGLLSPGFPLDYSQSLLSEQRMLSTPLLSGSGGFPAPCSTTSSFASHYNHPTSSLLGAALTQPDRYPSTENVTSSSDDDVIEVTGQ